MTSTEIVRSEINRFIRSPEPEVICITGEWGVGKTYTWDKQLRAAITQQDFGLSRYSYASLFGINSLEALKLTLVENLTFFDAPPVSFRDRGISLVKKLTSTVAEYNQLMEALPMVGPFISKAGPLYFSAVRKQIVCIDDLERRGDGLALRDVFGLISFLCEQRKCKVILLLNEGALRPEPPDKAEFDMYFEKVIDAKLVFSPTAKEALDIALRTSDEVDSLLRGYCETLGISNIRVIKKIERLVRQIGPHLERFQPEVRQQAIHSLVLFGWSKFQPTLAPPLEYYSVSSVARYFERKSNKQQTSLEEKKWDAILDEYKFTNMDDFDAELVKFVDTGALDTAAVTAKAEAQDAQITLQKKTGALEKAWAPFHGSFRDNQDEVVRSIVNGLKGSVPVVSLSNLNGAIVLLDEVGQRDDVESALEAFVAEKPPDFWDPSNDPFTEGRKFHPAVEECMAKQVARAEAGKTFDPEAELIQAAKSYDIESIGKLAELPVDEYYRMIKSKEGDEMRNIVHAGLHFRRIANASPEMLEVVRRVEEALKRIASESRLNAIRVARYGVTLP